MTGIVERYLSLSAGEQRIVRSACAAPDPGGALSLLDCLFRGSRSPSCGR